MTSADAITVDTAAQSPVLALRPLADADIRYAVSSWRESYKDSSAQFARAPWSMYKATVGKQIADLIVAPSTKTLGAFADDGRVIGWIAYAPGRSISTVHWCHTRFKLETPAGDEKCRRRGVMTMLLEAAELGKRFAYTMRGPRRVLHHGGQGRSSDAARRGVSGQTADVAIADWLRKRGITAAFVSLEEWLR